MKSFMMALLGAFFCGAIAFADLEKEFLTPPPEARPGVYWYFMDGNQDRGEMVKDLEAMAEVGIGSVLFLEVNIGIPTGPVSFMSPEWQDNVVHAFKAADRLGLEVILGTGPGWAGSGGSWIDPANSMQHLVASSTSAEGPASFNGVLPVPSPHKPNRFAGMKPEHAKSRNDWFKDVAVLAVPVPAQKTASIGENYDIKVLKDVRPFTIDKTAPHFVLPMASYPEPDPAAVIDPRRVVDITEHMKGDGSLDWQVPEGKWTLMRFVARSTGQTTRPAPRSGHGFECDKFSAAAYRHHWNQYQAKLIEKLGPLNEGKGLTTIHLDSWEMSSQNWSSGFRKEFEERRGYDPLPYYPAYMGQVVGSLELTERFLWDLRKTAQELVLENHVGAIRDIAHEHGLKYSNEPYDMNPAGDIDLGSVADIPACEFWNAENGHDAQYSCIEAVSIAHTMGKARVNAESFTTYGLTYLNFPGNMKNQTDWAFAMGINGILFHTYQHQPLGDHAKPGMTMGPYGVQWHRHRTMWRLFPAYHRYLARCSHLLRQGEAVADVLYLTPEGAPNIFVAPESALAGEGLMRDKKGYNFDAVTPRILKMRATVEEGRIVFPGGSRYRLLVLPQIETMTPETLERIIGLVEKGATVIGRPLLKSPSLSGYPTSDQRVAALSKQLWGDPSEGAREIGEGKALLFLSKSDQPKNTGANAGDSLYPPYEVTAGILRGLGIPEDFVADGPIRYGHRRTQDKDIYFVSNRSDQPIASTCTFRVQGRKAELWNPVTGEIRRLSEVECGKKTTSIPMVFEAHQSFFVVFSDQKDSGHVAAKSVNFPNAKTLQILKGSWSVFFDPTLGGPGNVKFTKLADWSKDENRGIRYYSGSAIYQKDFEITKPAACRVLIDLGTVHDMARVWVNGIDCGVVWCEPWQADITGALRTGENQLKVEVVNRWVNRLRGDDLEPDKEARTLEWENGLLAGKSFKAGRYSFSTRFIAGKEKGLLPSGLLGPVKVLSQTD